MMWQLWKTVMVVIYLHKMKNHLTITQCRALCLAMQLLLRTLLMHHQLLNVNDGKPN